MLSVATGATFFIAMPSQYLFNPAFQLKMVFIVIASLNTLAFYVMTARAVDSAGPDDAAPRAAQLIAGLSLTAWLTVIVLGRVITIFRPPYHWCPWC